MLHQRKKPLAMAPSTLRVLSQGSINKRTNMALNIVKYERNWTDGVNRGDVLHAEESYPRIVSACQKKFKR